MTAGIVAAVYAALAAGLGLAWWIAAAAAVVAGVGVEAVKHASGLTVLDVIDQ